MQHNQDITDAFSVFSTYDDFFVTKSGTLLGCVAFDGIDFDGLSENDCKILSELAKRAVEQLPLDVSLTQYYINVDDYKVKFKDREDPIIDDLVKRRSDALNKRGLSRSYLYYIFEFKASEVAEVSFSKDLLATLPTILFEKRSRERLKERLLNPGSLIINEAAWLRHVSAAKKNLNIAKSHWEKIGDTRIASRKEFWGLLRYLATYNPRYLQPEFQHEPLSDDLDLYVSDGAPEQKTIQYVDLLKVHGDRPRYARFLSVLNYQQDPAQYLIKENEAPLKAKGHYIVVNHFTPFSSMEKSKTFFEARNDLQRQSIDVMAMMKGDDSTPAEEGRYKFRKQAEELDKAEAVTDSWGKTWTTFILISKDPQKVIDRSEDLSAVLSGLGAMHVFENTGLPFAYQTTQPGGAGQSMRKSTVTSGRFGKISLHYKPANGSPVTDGLDNEEAQYVFETLSGEPFFFSPLVGERMFIVAVGPTRSGKTYFKNTMMSHFLKYGGLIRSVDIDKGGRCIGNVFTSNQGGGYFDIAEGGSLNPFIECEGPDDAKFKSHMLTLLKIMRQANDSEEDRKINSDEQRSLDQALLATMALPKEGQSLNSLLQQMNGDLKAKYERWAGDGLYKGVFDGIEDALGKNNNRIGVWNLAYYRDNPNVFKPLLMELFSRTTRLFEHDNLLNKPKLFEIDEAHHALQLPEFRQFIIAKIRTWAKYKAGITMWTQSPKDYLNTPDWATIRSSASTFIFMADGNMVPEEYKAAFPLDDGDIEAIKNLVPKSQAYVFQPEIGIGKTVILKVDDLQHMINTSTADEVTMRDALISQHGTLEGLRLAASRRNSGILSVVKESAA